MFTVKNYVNLMYVNCYMGEIKFYCATIAYHVGLNALLVAARHRRLTLEKNKHAVGLAS